MLFERVEDWKNLLLALFLDREVFHSRFHNWAKEFSVVLIERLKHPSMHGSKQSRGIQTPQAYML